MFQYRFLNGLFRRASLEVGEIIAFPIWDRTAMVSFRYQTGYRVFYLLIFSRGFAINNLTPVEIRLVFFVTSGQLPEKKQRDSL